MMTRCASGLLALALSIVPAVAGAQIMVNIAPPTLRVEVRPPQPSPAHTWIDGSWGWSGTQHVWSPGRWEQPPQPGRAWRQARWERRGQGYQYTPGAWDGSGGQPVAMVAPPQVPQVVPVMPAPQVGVPVMMAPPRMRSERRPRMIPPGQTWVPGYWQWNGTRHDWVAGHVEAPPNPRAAWQTPRWERRGRGWSMTPGRWR